MTAAQMETQMPTSVGSATTTGSPALVSSQDRGLQGLRSEDFFKILITEMQQQDPLEPSKTSDMLGQVADIRSIELNSRLTDTLDLMSKQQRTAGMSDYLGKFVAAATTNADNQQALVSGVVTGVRFTTEGAAVLDLDSGQAVRATDVVMVTTLEQAALSLSNSPVIGQQVKDATARQQQQHEQLKGGLLDWLKPGNWFKPQKPAASASV